MRGILYLWLVASLAWVLAGAAQAYRGDWSTAAYCGGIGAMWVAISIWALDIDRRAR